MPGIRSQTNKIPPPEEAPRRRRSSATDGNRKKNQPRRLSAPRRRRSTGELSGSSGLRVKSQFESLQRRGLSVVDTDRDKHVAFSFLEVREFPIILGDNPCCMEGPPVTIDWAHDPSTQFFLDVNTFERMRGDRRVLRDLILPKAVRERTLINCGFAKKEIAVVVRQVRKDKHSRMVSQQQTNLDPMHEAVEKATSGFKKMFTFKKSKYVKTLEAASTQPSLPPITDYTPRDHARSA